jgi:hypothetical protein
LALVVFPLADKLFTRKFFLITDYPDLVSHLVLHGLRTRNKQPVSTMWA